MKVEENKLKIKFEDVEVGGCFKLFDTSNKWDCGVYLKTSNDRINNAVCLNDGEMWDLGENVEVIPVNAKAVIE